MIDTQPCSLSVGAIFNHRRDLDEHFASIAAVRNPELCRLTCVKLSLDEILDLLGAIAQIRKLLPWRRERRGLDVR